MTQNTRYFSTATDGANNRPMAPAWTWALFILLPVLFLALLYLVDRPEHLDPAYRLSEGEYQVNYGLSPTDNKDWSPVKLPANVSSYPHYASVWYRFSVSRMAEGTSSTYAFYAQTPKGNLNAFVNGTEIGSGGSGQPPVAEHRAPLLFEFPADLMRPGQNELLIHRTQMSGNGGLSRVYFGPVEIFEADAHKLTALRFWAPFVVLVFMIVVFIIMIALFALRRKDTTYGWYAAAIAFWGCHHAWELVTAIPIANSFFWVSISYMTLGGFVFSAAVFNHRFLDSRYPRIERSLLIWMLIGCTTLLSLSLAGFWQYVIFARYVWVPSINLVGLYIVIQLIRGVRRKPNGERISLLLVAWIVVVVGLRDYLWEFNLGLPGSTYYLPFSAGLVLSVFSFILMLRFARALELAEDLNSDLEFKVADRTQALEDNFKALQELEKERALFEERDRIMRDMHDGLGGQLVQMLSVVERQPRLQAIEPELRSALQDLRIIIDSLSPSDGDLLSVLAAFRHRVEKVVKRNGIRFSWQVSDIPTLPNLGPERVLHLLRILQECVTNTIKHANATRIAVSTVFSPVSQQVEVIFTDNGTGFSVPEASAGHGLRNMRRRASDIDSQIDIDSSKHGTTVRLILSTTHELSKRS